MTNIQPVKPPETGIKGMASRAWTWITGEWHNLVTAGSALYLALKAAGKL